jgi:phosphatidylglycerol:prolipoprotein diacylglycerol transferase
MLSIFRNIFSPPRHLILLILAAWIGLFLAEKKGEKYGIAKNDLNNLVFFGLAGFIIGGRLSFALQNINSFVKSPPGIISINPDLFDPYGGIAAAFIILLIFTQRRGLSFWSTLDALTPLFVILSAGIGLSHLAAGTGFGNPTKVPWGIHLWNDTRHPSQLYETLASLIILAWFWFKKPNRRPGIDFLTIACMFSISVILLSIFRADSTLILNGYKAEQVIAWIALAILFVLIEYRFKQPNIK